MTFRKPVLKESTVSANANMPVLYSEIVPLDFVAHKSWKCLPSQGLSWLARNNLVPLTVDEFRLAQRHYPIVFSSDPQPVPLALMGLAPGTNAFISDEGYVSGRLYIPAYVRRYPFILAREYPDASELALCVDRASGLVGDFEEGAVLFDSGKLSDAGQRILAFCEEFERAAERTRLFVADLIQHNLLIDGKATIDQGAQGQQVFDGFQIINADAVSALTSNLRDRWFKNGHIQAIQAHVFSLDAMGFLQGTAKSVDELILSEQLEIA